MTLHRLLQCFILIVTPVVFIVAAPDGRTEDVVTAGWIGPITGPVSKLASYQAAQVAEKDINESGGINGKAFRLVYEDGKGSSVAAVSAVQKLLSVDKVHFIIGGHCSPESLPISPIVQSSGALMLAAVTSSPKLTEAGDNIFRVTAVSTNGVDLILKHLSGGPHKKFSVVYEETDYASPLAEYFKKHIDSIGGSIVSFDPFSPGETDLRSIAAKIKNAKPDAVYIAVQSPDSALLLVTQLKALDIKGALYGNEIAGTGFQSAQEKAEIFNGLTFPEPKFDEGGAALTKLKEQFSKLFGAKDLPGGFWTAESYDAVILLAEMMRRCGTEVSSVKHCLYNLKDYTGATGSISLDQNGDGIRSYVLKVVALDSADHQYKAMLR